MVRKNAFFFLYIAVFLLFLCRNSNINNFGCKTWNNSREQPTFFAFTSETFSYSTNSGYKWGKMLVKSQKFFMVYIQIIHVRNLTIVNHFMVSTGLLKTPFFRIYVDRNVTDGTKCTKDTSLFLGLMGCNSVDIKLLYVVIIQTKYKFARHAENVAFLCWVETLTGIL